MDVLLKDLVYSLRMLVKRPGLTLHNANDFADVHRQGLDRNVQPEMYVSVAQRPERRMNVVVRTDARNALELTPTRVDPIVALRTE